MKVEVLLRLLASAEKRLRIDGLFIRLQSDGSGCVTFVCRARRTRCFPVRSVHRSGRMASQPARHRL